MSTPRLLPLVLLLPAALATCDRGAPDSPAAPGPQGGETWLQPVLEELEARHGRRGLPELAAPELGEIREVLEAWRLASSRLRAPMQRDLEQRPAERLSAALLAILEDLRAPVEERRAAYAWLEARGVPAILPRLVLRLKYETDWAANLPLIRTLLRLGNGAGLAALETILRSEDPEQEALRAEAAAALLLLPPGAGWEPRPETPLAERFAGDFAHLLRVRQVWDRARRLAPAPGAAAAPEQDPFQDRGLRAEVVAMLRHLASRSLRPVDDARFVLARLQAGVLPFLCAAVRERHPYVREACLQVLAWIGPAAGRWILQGHPGCLQTLRQALARDAAARPRILEALGALGLAAAAPAVRPWIEDADPETATAAADALLRCAPEDPALLPEIGRLLARPDLAPEARWSLLLLGSAMAPDAPPPEPPAALAPGEVARRRRWLQERALRPEASAPTTSPAPSGS